MKIISYGAAGEVTDSIHAVVLSHAHIDHSGLLPMLAKLGYRGPLYSTHATRDLCSIMLQDSAHIQKRDAEWLSRKHTMFIPPLYQPEDVSEIMRHFISVPYKLRFPLLPGVFVTFHEAGHVLGSAMVEFEYEEQGKPRRSNSSTRSKASRGASFSRATLDARACPF
ncbi:MAG: hypothetical protein HYV26_06045 [Candidatus Hydrogenedentes bacterium]|nr:hypothetical protein [Candidatus Hydrogenedentota bacterium]